MLLLLSLQFATSTPTAIFTYPSAISIEYLRMPLHYSLLNGDVWNETPSPRSHTPNFSDDDNDTTSVQSHERLTASVHTFGVTPDLELFPAPFTPDSRSILVIDLTTSTETLDQHSPQPRLAATSVSFLDMIPSPTDQNVIRSTEPFVPVESSTPFLNVNTPTRGLDFCIETEFNFPQAEEITREEQVQSEFILCRVLHL